MRDPQSRSNRRGLRISELVPWFITGFLALLLLRSAGFIPPLLLRPVTGTAAFLTTIAMAGLGLGVDVRAIARTGVRVTLAVTASLISTRPDELYPDPGRRHRLVTVAAAEMIIDLAERGLT